MPKNENENINEGAETKRKRGRPRKVAEPALEPAPEPEEIIEEDGLFSEEEIQAVTPTGKKRGRKPFAERLMNESKQLFALDIGTRSVIGIVAEQTDEGLRIIATERQEHKTRAMLDGQIHDVPQVAAVINSVKKALERRGCTLKKASVAAAGRALYTETAEAELEFNGLITADMERRLDFAGVQAAQTKLTNSERLEDAANYYCVGYSTIKYVLDGVQLKTLIGQRGRNAKATVIATFLPRQVIDSMHSALKAVKLDMQALTLEPIAAINVLIPPTMRHLNLVLVDIGAGTSDVAITNNGSVVAYGMVPVAGDEVTEAISQKYLLDFNVAENVKRDAADGRDVRFPDILGQIHEMTADEVIEPIMPTIKMLAEQISKQIRLLNNTEPQAVLLVGGGSLTPNLARLVAQELKLPEERVAVRRPENVDGIVSIPEKLCSPDAVTPLGILKIASLNTLHFLTVFVNDEEYNLFNFRNLTVSDALINAGISLKNLNGRPGLGIKLNLNGETKFIPGSLGSLARVKLNGEDADLDTPVTEGSRIELIPGADGTTPVVTLGEVIDPEDGSTVYVNGHERLLPPSYLVNDHPADNDYVLADDDVITTRLNCSLGEALKTVGYPPQGTKITYKLNGQQTTYTQSPDILLNDEPATISAPVHDGDHIEYIPAPEPKLGDIMKVTETEAYHTIYFNKAEYKIPSASVSMKLNGRPATMNSIVSEGCSVEFTRSDRAVNTVSDILLAVGYNPPSPESKMKVTILVNDRPAEYTDPVKNGDNVETKYVPFETVEDASERIQKPAEKFAQKNEQSDDVNKLLSLDNLLGGEKPRERIFTGRQRTGPLGRPKDETPKDTPEKSSDGLKDSLLGDGLKDSLLGENKPKLRDSLLGDSVRERLLADKPKENLKDSLLGDGLKDKPASEDNPKDKPLADSLLGKLS